jgi:hypothetical protein
MAALAVAAMLGGSLSAPVVQSVFADSRCSGAGITVWQDSNISGPSATWCTSGGTLYIPVLGDKSDNLGFFANWNDRITSYQMFNQTSSGRACLVQDNYLNYSDATRNSTLQGNNTLMYVGAGPDNQASSLFVATYNYTCTTS